MAFGRRLNSMKIVRGNWVKGDEEELRLELVRYTRSFGRKRILISKNEESSTLPLKRLCSDGFVLEELPCKSAIETLPQDILIRILCGVEHKDLKQLVHVSKAIRDATLIAKKLHFAYSTPTKTPAFRTPINVERPSDFDEIEAPNAPRQPRQYKSRMNGKNLTDMSVALFSSPKKALFMD